MKINKFIVIALTVAVCSLPAVVKAQFDQNQNQSSSGTSSFDPTDPPPPPPQDPGAPIDGGLGLLLAAGAAYGVKKYREGKRGGVE